MTPAPGAGEFTDGGAFESEGGGSKQPAPEKSPKKNKKKNKGKKNKELSINEKSIVRIVFEARVQCHSDAVSCLLVAGGTLFSAGHDFAIVTWLAPELEEHDEVNELSLIHI